LPAGQVGATVEDAAQGKKRADSVQTETVLARGSVGRAGLA
jgi:hypothetical protein